MEPMMDAAILGLYTQYNYAVALLAVLSNQFHGSETSFLRRFGR